jgi:hypothetical protein
MATLAGIHDALRPGGRLVFESRDPGRRVWEDWRREWAPERVELAGVGVIESQAEVIRVEDSLVTFDEAITFPDGTVVPTSSTLRFRERDELAASLIAAGFQVDDVRDAPDRPGHEFVFVASRQPPAASQLGADAGYGLNARTGEVLSSNTAAPIPFQRYCPLQVGNIAGTGLERATT